MQGKRDGYRMKKEYHDPFTRAEKTETKAEKKPSVEWKDHSTKAKTNKELWVEYRENKQKK